VIFLHEDLHPEPRHLILYVFSIGILITIPVLGSQIAFQKISNLSPDGSLLFIIGIVVIEEVFKFCAGYFAVWKKTDFDEPMDAMIYLIVAALGFATVENLFTVATQMFGSYVAPTSIVVDTLALRFIGATLLHTLTAGIVGYYWAIGIMKKEAVRYVVMGLVLAVIVHTAFNYLMYLYQDINVLYPTIFLVGVAFFVIEDFQKIKEDEREGKGFDIIKKYGRK
jgi:RsiW-degrading membrane proteinase PrsW (M82 family)